MSRRACVVIATMLPADGLCGVQTHVQAVAAAARAAGHEVLIATPYSRSVMARRATNALGRVVRHCSRESAEMWTKWSLAMHLRSQLRSALTRAGRAACVYAQDPMSTEVALSLRAEGHGFRLVSVVHYNDSEAQEHENNGCAKRGGRLWRSLMEREARTLPRVDRLLFVSRFMRRIVEARVPAIRDTEVCVIPNFPRPSPTGTAPTIDGDILAIGTLEPRKNQAFLLQVLAASAQRGYRYRLTLAGDGPSRSELERLASQLGIREQVVFLGYVPGASTLIGGHRLLVHAARIENFGLVFVEAMREAVPSIAAPVGGIPEIFDDHAQGRYWDLTDVDGAARILVETLEDEPRRVAMGRSARRRFEALFSPEVLAPRWLDALLDSSPQQGGLSREMAAGQVV